LEQFQSLQGLILTKVNSLHPALINEVSIPPRADFNPATKLSCSASTIVSIPPRADFNVDALHRNMSMSRVSIPPRADFNQG